MADEGPFHMHIQTLKTHTLVLNWAWIAVIEPVFSHGKYLMFVKM